MIAIIDYYVAISEENPINTVFLVLSIMRFNILRIIYEL